MERWTDQQCAVAVDTYFKNDCLDAIQCIFRRNFNFGCHVRFADVCTIIKWVNSFRLTASACKRKPEWSKRMVRTPGNDWKCSHSNHTKRVKLLLLSLNATRLFFLNYIWLIWILTMYGFNRMELQSTRQEFVWNFCIKPSLKNWFLILMTFHGDHHAPVWHL